LIIIKKAPIAKNNRGFFVKQKLKASKYSVPLFSKEGLGEILLDKSPSIPLFQRGR
jgi:hypothetical protein